MNDEVERVWTRIDMVHSKYMQVIPIYVRRDSSKQVRVSLELAGILTGSRSFYLPNKSLELYPAAATNITMTVTGPLC